MPKYNQKIKWYGTIKDAENFDSCGSGGHPLHLTSDDITRLANGEVLVVSVMEEYHLVIVHDSKHPSESGEAPIHDSIYD